MSYSRIGIHLLQKAPDDWLLALNPQVLVYACAWENQSEDTIQKYRDYAIHLTQLLPDSVIGIRWWPDDNILNRFTPQQYADKFFKYHIPGTILMVGNEDDPVNYSRTVDLHTQVVKLATVARIPLGVCCTSMGNPTIASYLLLQTLFDAMQDGRSKNVVHWWRPNTYSPLPLNHDLIEQHYREARKLKNYPPTFYGEYNLLPVPLDIPVGTWIANIKDSTLPVPAAIYCYGDGIYGDGWKDFNLGRNQEFMKAMLNFDRTDLTAYEEWKKLGTDIVNPYKCPLPKIITQPGGLKLRKSPSISGEVIRLLVAGERVTVYTKPVFISDSYQWQRVITASGEEGWSASAVINIPSFADPC